MVTYDTVKSDYACLHITGDVHKIREPEVFPASVRLLHEVLLLLMK